MERIAGRYQQMRTLEMRQQGKVKPLCHLA
jgi:hypothetical protein